MLPIDAVLPALRTALAERGVAVLQAPPGAGKTTRVPLALLGQPWLGGRRIVMLEPRRLAARAAARYMARSLGEEVGGIVGYRVRGESRVSARTVVEVVTEGILTRMLQADQALEDAGVVIFDEFHERSVHADLGLALLLQSRELVRPDLRLLVMSATLDGGPIATMIGGGDPAPVITTEGRAYPVGIRYLPRAREQSIEASVSRAVRRAIAEHDGDVLAFLPGAAEIGRVGRQLHESPLPGGTFVVPLHGSLDARVQDQAIAPAPPGRRKVVLSTNIAQTSLTIEGVRVVVDSGLARTPRFSPRTGMTRLETARISAASAEQRRGRAGRMAPGICYRLWDEHEQAALVPFDRPEILDTDLAPLALELAVAGVVDPAALRWLDLPPAAALANARELLRQLEAVDADGRVTAHGRAIAAVPAHPRIGHMVVRARERDAASLATACDIAVLLERRDVLRPARQDDPGDADLRLRLDVLQDLRAGHGVRERAGGALVDAGAVRAALEESRQLRRTLRIPVDAASDPARCGELLLLAYPDRVAQRRAGGGVGIARYLLRSGSGASLRGSQSLGDAAWLAVGELGGTAAEPRIFTAAPVTLDELETIFSAQVTREEVVAWDASSASVRARRRIRLGALVLREGPMRDPDPSAVASALADGIRDVGIDALPWDDGSRALRARLAFLHRLDDGWPDVSDAALASSLDRWLTPNLPGVARLGDVDLRAALLSLLTWERRQQLDRLAPTHIEVPSGSRIRVDYTDPAQPVLAVRLQEVFGMQETPRIGAGRVPLTVHLLSPAMRPVQVTQDLAGFWRGSYFDVRKDMKGRYPKHYWPDDPLVAEPRRGRGAGGGGRES